MLKGGVLLNTGLALQANVQGDGVCIIRFIERNKKDSTSLEGFSKYTLFL